MNRFGYLQRHMIGFLERSYGAIGRKDRHYIGRDRESKRVAESLERRNLVKINRDFCNWTVRLL
jgi:hypothetical protein